jgi:hypothetical protein
VIRRIAIGSGEVTTFVGVGGRHGVRPGALPGGLNQPYDVAWMKGGALAILDAGENVVLVAR